MTSLLASTLASFPAWALSAVLDGHVSAGTDIVLSFVVWGICFVPAYVWIKRMREGG